MGMPGRFTLGHGYLGATMRRFIELLRSLVIPAVNVGYRSAELYSITDWARKNNIKLNLAKSKEIIFVDKLDKRRKADFSAPAIMPVLQRVHVLKILGVTLTIGLSVSLHVQNVITTCAQTLYALRVLRAHGLCVSALQISS